MVKENNRLFSDWGGWRQKPRQEPIVDEDKEISMGQSMRFRETHYKNQCRSLLVQLTGNCGLSQVLKVCQINNGTEGVGDGSVKCLPQAKASLNCQLNELESQERGPQCGSGPLELTHGHAWGGCLDWLK